MEHYTGPKVNLAEVTDDGSMQMLLDIKSIAENAHVYVGIPEEETSRKIPYVAKDIPTNAGLLFIHTHGSDIRNIPPKPVIEPAVENDRDGLGKYIAAAINNYLEGDVTNGNRNMELAGTRAANDAKRWFRNPNNGWPRNKYDTIRRKLLRGLRNQPKKLKKALATLSLAGDEGDVTGLDQTLVDYGEMKRAITYVTDLPASVTQNQVYKPTDPNKRFAKYDNPKEGFEIEDQRVDLEYY